MRVLHVLASNRYSGAENVVCQIIEMFQGEVDMAYCSPDGPIQKSLDEKGIQFFPLSKLNAKELKKVIAKYNPDVIHAHDFKASILSSKFSKKARVVSTIHGNKKGMDKLSLKSVIFNIFSKKLDMIIWVSKSCFNDYYFKSKVEDKSITLHNILSIDNLNKKALADKSNEKYDVVFLGRLVVEKNPLRLVEIAKEVTLKQPNFKMCIIGDGEYREQMQSLVNHYGLTENVIFKGFLRNPHVILNNSKVMLMTSIMEGTPMCSLEALGLGVPMVSTKVDGLVEIIEEGYNGYLYDTNEEAVNHILTLISDNELLEKISNNCKEWSKTYNDISKYTEKLINIYNN